jgi:hypothetical protein
MLQHNMKNLHKGWKYWSVFGVSVLLLSQSFAAFRKWSALPSVAHLMVLVVIIGLLAACFLYLSFVMYAVEKKAGRVAHSIKFFEKWLAQ